PGGGGTDHAFRQTGLDGGNSRLGLGRTFHKNYGEVLHPELSNLHILTAGTDIPVTEHTDMGLTYFNYRLVRENTSLRSSGITAPLSGTDKDIGQALDFVLNVDLDDELGFKTPHTDDTAF